MSRSTRVTLICHGTTEAAKTVGFPADEPLLPRQGDMLEQVTATLPHAHAVVSAPELRARQTAAAIAGEFEVDSALRDVDYGRWAGRSLAEVQDAEAENLMTWITDVDAAPHGGESIAATVGRIGGWLGERITVGGHIVAITHPAILRAAIVSILGAPAASLRNIDAQPWSKLSLTSDGHRWALRSFGLPTA